MPGRRATTSGRGCSPPLLESPRFFAGTTLPRPDTMFHAGLARRRPHARQPDGQGDRPQGGRGLTAAWRARAVLGLGARADEGRIVAAVDAVARGPFFRYPYVRLNQINWNAELYAYAAALTGNPELLVDDYRRHVRRFVAGARKPLQKGWARNLSPATASSTRRPTRARTRTSTRPSTRTSLHFIVWYEQALRAGMRPLPRPTCGSCGRGPRACSSATGCTTGCSAGTAGWASSAG